MTEVVSAVIESVVREDATPVAPPRRKRKMLRLQRLELESSTSENKLNSPGAEIKTKDISSASQISQSISPSASEAQQRLRGSSVSVYSSDRCESPIGHDKDSTFVRDSAEKLTMNPLSSRVENYYSGSGMRRKSVPSNSAINKPSPSATSASVSPADLDHEKSATPSSSDAPVENQSPTKTKPPPRPSAVPSRPPRPPSCTGCTNKVAPLSQLYAATNASAAKDTIVIDSKCSQTSGDKQKPSVTSRYGKICEAQSAVTEKDRNKDDASRVYGKRTQAALNTLVATVKMFNKGTSSGQKTTSTARKTIKSKTPPKRPPPAVRNTPRPPIPKTMDYDLDESLYVNQYEDHIYMEVGKALKAGRTASMQCYSGDSRNRLKEGEGREDPYVIMNPVNSSSSHIYTSLDIRTKDEFKGQKMHAIVRYIYNVH